MSRVAPAHFAVSTGSHRRSGIVIQYRNEQEYERVRLWEVILSPIPVVRVSSSFRSVFHD